ncbi:MAG: FtsX-like permease family protein [Candidatus Hodarchaeota archaeon]
MSATSFALRDIKERKGEVVTGIFSLNMAVSINTLILHLGGSLGISISGGLRALTTAGFRNLFFHFVIFSSILCFILTSTVIAFIISTMMERHTRNIGIMKAIGSLSDNIHHYFMVETLIIGLTGILSGIALGLALYFTMGQMFLVAGFGFPVGFRSLETALVAIVSFTLIYVFGSLEITRGLELKVVDALYPEESEEQLKVKKLSAFSKFLSKMGQSFRVAIRSIKSIPRRSRRTFAIVTVGTSLIVILLFGTALARNTTISYVSKGSGQDIFAIGNPDVLEQYTNMMRSFSSSETSYIEDFDFLNGSYLFNTTLLQELEKVEELEVISGQLLAFSTIDEIYHIVIDPNDPDNYRRIGDSRHAETLVVGLDPASLVTEWFMEGRFITRSDSQIVAIGDSLAFGTFEDPLQQSLILLEENFAICGIILDPLNNGNTLYINIDELQELVGLESLNLVLVKGSDSPGLTSEAGAIIEELGLSYVSLQPLVNTNIQFMGNLWNFISILSVLPSLTLFFTIVNTLTILTTNRKKDLAIMRALGAKRMRLLKTLIAESVILTTGGGVLGIVVGLVFIALFLIPMPVWPSIFTLLAVLTTIIVILFATCLISTYPAYQMIKRPPTETL